MPTVPKIEQQVKQEITPAVNVGAGLTNPEIPQTMQQQVPDFKTGMEKTNAVAEALINKEIQRIDNAVGMENNLKLGAATDTIEKQMLQYKGKDASKAATESDRLWAEEAKKIYDKNVHTRAQDETFQRAYDQNTLKLKANVGSHVAKETDAYVHETYKAAIANNADMGGKNPNLFEAKLKENEQVTKDFGKLNGKSDEWIKNEVQTNNSILVDNSIKNYLNNDDPNGALAVYNIYQNYIPEEKRLAMGKLLKDFVNQHTAVAIANEVYDKTGKTPLDVTLEKAYVKAGDNVILREKIHNQLITMDEVTKKSNEVRIKNAYIPLNNAAADLYRQGIIPSDSNMDKNVMLTAQTANSEKFRELMDHFNTQRRVAATRTDAETKADQATNYINFVNEVVNNTEVGQKIDSTEKLARGDINDKQAVSLNNIILKHNPLKDAKVQNQGKRLYDAFNAQLKAAKAANDEALINEANKSFALRKQQWADFIQNNYEAENAVFDEKMQAFVDTIIKPAEADALGKFMDFISRGSPNYDIAVEQKKQELKNAIGQQRAPRGTSGAKTPVSSTPEAAKPPAGSGARLAPDGYYYISDPKRPGKYMRWQ